MTTNKYLILHGKHSRWEDVDGVQTQVTRKPGDIIEMTLLQAQERQQSTRLATAEDIAAYEARLRGDDVLPTIPDTHVSTAGAAPAPAPTSDPLQPPATAEQPPERHFPAPAAPVVAAPPPPPDAPAAHPVATPAADAPPPPSTPAAPPVSKTRRVSDKAENDGKPKARTSAKKTSGSKSRSRR